MKYKVYIETSVISYLTARPSRDLIVAAHQESTRIWWSDMKDNFELYISQLVIDEVQKGDFEASSRRMEQINNFRKLNLTNSVTELAFHLVSSKAVPKNSVEDAFHISFSAVHKMDFLLTWNFKHIANAVAKKKIESSVNAFGYKLPLLCSPLELVRG